MMMALNYALFENHLTTDPTDYMAVVQNQQSKTQDDVIDLMISRGSTVTRAEALAVFEEYALAFEQLVKNGFAVNTPLFNLSLSVKGVFTREDESFNPSVHSVKINVSPGIRLKEMVAGVNVVRVQGASPKPDPLYLDDLGSGTRNESLTPGNIAQLKGSRLKFDPADAAQGIFLVAANGSETRVATISRNKPAQVDFLVPALAAGTYRLEVRVSLYKTNGIRTGGLPAELTVT
ncbi:DNA-binding domain-containing protein [Gaoshiqia sp. Z1-71]|uniref:HU family DNA-binding protein n=1 Tax=Gaoshiqia hydrogeniformans TaxID=3290090 RepID=UPI003BF8D1D5